MLKGTVEFDLDLFNRMDDDDRSAIPTVAREIRNRIEKGTSIDDISNYKRETLRMTLSFFRVADRSKVGTKEEMAQLLVNAFRHGKNEYGDKSRKVKIEKQKSKEEDRFIYIQNEVINAIRKRGGL